MTPPSCIAQCLALTSPAETAFRSRWRLSTLQRLDPELHQLLTEQIDLYNAALVTGSDAEARTQAEAMVRGWRAACAALEAPLQPDDSYQIGHCYSTGTKVVISDQSHSVGRVQAMKDEHGKMGRVLIVTPDEVAKLIAGMTIIADIKSCFPDSEVVEVCMPNGACNHV